MKKLLEWWKLHRYRAAILRRRYSMLANVCNVDRFGEYFDEKHVNRLLRRADFMHIIVITRAEKLPVGIYELAKKENVRIHILSPDECNFETEMLISDKEVLVSDGKIHSIIDNPRFAADMRQIFDGLWLKARPLSIEEPRP